MDPLAALSTLCGWAYTLCWSLSFYPQPLLNHRRRSVAGTTIDFPFLNSLGFLAYLLSTTALRYSPTVRAQYAARHHGLTPTVAVNDVVFAGHALVLTLVTLSQYGGGWWRVNGGSGVRGGGPRRAPQASGDGGVPSAFQIPSFPILAVAACSVVAVAVTAASASALTTVYALGYVKLAVTLVKYSPQVLANWRNGSTRGWSIAQILLDLAGGALSLAQLLLDSYRQHDWSGLTGNPVKLGLSNASMAYDGVFMVQHYVLYWRGAEDAHGHDDDDNDDDSNDSNDNHSYSHDDNDNSSSHAGPKPSSEQDALLDRRGGV